MHGRKSSPEKKKLETKFAIHPKTNHHTPSITPTQQIHQILTKIKENKIKLKIYRNIKNWLLFVSIWVAYFSLLKMSLCPLQMVTRRRVANVAASQRRLAWLTGMIVSTSPWRILVKIAGFAVKIYIKPIQIGGFNPFQKYAQVKWDHFPKNFGYKQKKIVATTT